jgi:hypothetical protein
VRAIPESADEYPHVVATLTDGRRVIECAADIQWVIQVHKCRLPFFVSGAGGFAIMSRDLGQWRAAVESAGCCGE